MKRKVLSILLSTSLLITGIVGCGSESASEGDSSGGQSATNTEAWKDENITLQVPGKSGGGSDLTTRLISTAWQENEGIVTSIENYDNTAVCYQTIKNAKPDGETLSLAHSGLITQYLTGSLDVKPETHLSLIGYFGNNGIVAFCAREDAPYDTMDEFVEYAKANPGEVKAGYSPNGTTHFRYGKIESYFDIDLNYVEASNESDRLTNLAGGFNDVGTISLATAIEYEKAGKIKILGTIGAPGSSINNFVDDAQENWQTFEEMGYDGLTFSTNYYVFGPKGMDDAMVESMNQSLKTITEDGSSYMTGMYDMGQIGDYATIDESKQILADEMVDLTAVAKDIGVYGLE